MFLIVCVWVHDEIRIVPIPRGPPAREWLLLRRVIYGRIQKNVCEPRVILRVGSIWRRGSRRKAVEGRAVQPCADIGEPTIDIN